MNCNEPVKHGVQTAGSGTEISAEIGPDKIIIDQIPELLKTNDIWASFLICYDPNKDKYSKRPIHGAKCNDFSTLVSFEEACQRMTADTGIACALPVEKPSGPGLTVIDIDNCFINGHLTAPANQIVEMFSDTYIERSVSGRGVHIFFFGEPWATGHKTLLINGEEINIEIYSSQRFIIMTGLLVNNAPSVITLKQDALDGLASMVNHLPETSSPRVRPDPVALRHTESLPDEIRKLACALGHLSPDDYEEWFRIGIALKRYGVENKCEDLCWELFDEWSRHTKKDNYAGDENRRLWDRWDTESHPEPITIATIFSLARQRGWDARTFSSSQNGKQGGRPPNPAPIYAASEVFKRLLDQKSGTPVLIKTPKGWHRYRGLTGWQKISLEEAKQTITGIMQDHEELKNTTSSSYLHSVLDNLNTKNFCCRDVDYGSWIMEKGARPARNMIAFSDGWILDMEKLRNIPLETWDGFYGEELFVRIKDALLPASAAFFSRSYVPYPLIPEEPPELFTKYLRRVMPDQDDQRMLAQLAGIVLSDETCLEKMWFLFGSGQNGKGIFARVLEALVGEDGVCALNLSQLSQDRRFSEWPLTEHKLNLDAELAPSERKETERVESLLKAVVSGETKQVERKGVDMYRGTFTARLVFLANKLPMFSDSSDAIYRRFLVIPFNEAITEEEKNPNLRYEIVVPGVLSGIFWWAMKGWVSVWNEGVYESENAQKAKNTHFEDCFPERGFFKDCCVSSSDGFVPRHTLEECFVTWCRENGVPGTMQRLTNYIQRVRGFKLKQRRLNGNRVRGYEGLRLQEQGAPELVDLFD